MSLQVMLGATEPQWDIITCESPVMVLVCGRRWGKTFTIRNRLLHDACATPGGIFWYVAPTYYLCRREFNAWVFHPALRRIIRSHRLQPVPSLTLRNGAEISFRSGDRPHNLRGDGLHGIAADEGATLRQELVTEVLGPALLDRGGWLLLAGTFYGMNWFYDWYKRGGDKRFPEYQSWLYPTPSGIRFQGPKGKARLDRYRNSVPTAVWEQECLCIPSGHAKQCFRFVDRIEAAAGRITGPRNGHSYVLAWDTGKSSDPSAIVVLEDSGLVAYTQVLPLDLDFREQLRIVEGHAKKWKAGVVVDSTGAGTRDAIVDFARGSLKNVRGVMFKGRESETFVKELDLAMQEKRLKVPLGADRNDELLRQLRLYEAEYNPRNARWGYGAPAGEHDDLVAALAMANFARVRGWIANPNARPLSEVLH